MEKNLSRGPAWIPLTNGSRCASRSTRWRMVTLKAPYPKGNEDEFAGGSDDPVKNELTSVKSGCFMRAIAADE